MHGRHFLQTFWKKRTDKLVVEHVMIIISRLISNKMITKLKKEIIFKYEVIFSLVSDANVCAHNKFAEHENHCTYWALWPAIVPYSSHTVTIVSKSSSGGDMFNVVQSCTKHMWF